LANTASAIKRIRSNERKRLYNKMVRTRTRTALRSARETLTDSSSDQARKQVMEAVSSLDRAAQKGVIHKNNAARRKGRLMKKLNALNTQK